MKCTEVLNSGAIRVLVQVCNLAKHSISLSIARLVLQTLLSTPLK